MTDCDSSREFVDKVQKEVGATDTTFRGFPGFYVRPRLASSFPSCADCVDKVFPTGSTRCTTRSVVISPRSFLRPSSDRPRIAPSLHADDWSPPTRQPGDDKWTEINYLLDWLNTHIPSATSTAAALSATATSTAAAPAPSTAVAADDAEASAAAQAGAERESKL